MVSLTVPTLLLTGRRMTAGCDLMVENSAVLLSRIFNLKCIKPLDLTSILENIRAGGAS